MGSGTSRGKKVAPACVSEVNVTKTSVRVTPSKQDSRSFKPLRIHSILRNARSRAPPDSRSEGHESEFSGEEDDIDGELDTVLADYEERDEAHVKKNPVKKTFSRSKTYGLCHFRKGENEEDSRPASRVKVTGKAKEPRGSHGATRDVNKRSNDAFTHFNKHTPPRSHLINGCLTTGAVFEVSPASEKQRIFDSCSSAPTKPVILYDGSEEELMDTIEREFS
ncbi:uncharacterized protein ACBR49_013667 [Aulostomus maculatus]